MNNHPNAPFAVILAGGSGRRMGQQVSKPLVQLRNRPMIEYVLDSLQAQSRQILISHNESDALYEYLGCVMLHDMRQPPQGPLAGILSAMEYICKRTEYAQNTWLLSAAADCPFLPDNFSHGLMATVEQSQKTAAFIQHQGQAHFLTALWSTTLLAELKKHLSEGNYSVRSFLKRIDAVQYEYPVAPEPHQHHLTRPFFNINTPADLATAESLLRTSSTLD